MWLFGLLTGAGKTEALPNYNCKKAVETIKIDGHLSEQTWSNVPYVTLRTVVRGSQPKESTKVMAAWNSRYLYIAFVTKDRDVKGRMTQHDGKLWKEEPVEIFLDPDGDGKNYMEFEWNCLNTWLDFLIPNAKSHYNASWSAPNTRSAVFVDETANNSSDIDKGMTVEIALAWRDMITTASRPLPPEVGDILRINFYRYNQINGTSENTAWSPTGTASFHVPEKFGILTISNTDATKGIPQTADASVLSGPKLLIRPGLSDICIEYGAKTNSFVYLKIMDVSGRTVKTLVNGDKISGTDCWTKWDKRDSRGEYVPGGIYWIFMQSRTFQKTRVIYLK